MALEEALSHSGREGMTPQSPMSPLEAFNRHLAAVMDEVSKHCAVCQWLSDAVAVTEQGAWIKHPLFHELNSAHWNSMDRSIALFEDQVMGLVRHWKSEGVKKDSKWGPLKEWVIQWRAELLNEWKCPLRHISQECLWKIVCAWQYIPEDTSTKQSADIIVPQNMTYAWGMLGLEFMLIVNRACWQIANSAMSFYKR